MSYRFFAKHPGLAAPEEEEGVIFPFVTLLVSGYVGIRLLACCKQLKMSI